MDNGIQPMASPSLVEQAHIALAAQLRNGDIAIDATVGNGHDTRFLARAVGEQGRVYGFDIQQQALDSAWRGLTAEGLAQRVSLYHAGHETMAIVLPDSLHGRVRAVMFNLGYLPGGDKSRTTAMTTTVSALQQALVLLAPDGLLSIMVYTGHGGGAEEAAAVRAWIEALPVERYHRAWLRPHGTRTAPPEWWLVQGRGDSPP